MLGRQNRICCNRLRPSGKVIIDGEYYDAVADKGFIDKGDEVVVRRYGSFQLM